MEFKITLRTVQDIELFRAKLAGIRIQLVVFQRHTIKKFANLIITDAIHRKMHEAGFSKKIIAGTLLDNIEFIGTKKVRLFFKSEYFASTGFDVALAREEGTKRHFIAPVKKKALYGGEKWPYFSKGHWVSGIPALHIVEETVKESTEWLQDRYNQQQKDWYEKNLGGIEIAS